MYMYTYTHQVVWEYMYAEILCIYVCDQIFVGHDMTARIHMYILIYIYIHIYVYNYMYMYTYTHQVV